MLSKTCSQRCGLINSESFHVWCGQLTQVVPTRPCLLKCCEVRGGFAINPRSARTAVNVGVGKKTMRQSPAKASLALDCSAAAPPWPASRRIALRALFMDVPAGTSSSPGAAPLPAPTGVWCFMQCLCVCWVWGAPGALEKVQKMLLTVGMDGHHPVCRWLFQ